MVLRQKLALGLPLTGAENRLYEHILETVYGNKKEVREYTPDGVTVVTTTIDAEPVMDAVKMSSEIDAPVRNDRGMLHLGSIDAVTARNWAKECGAAIGTKEFAAYAKKKLQSGEFSRFQVKRKKRYV